MKAIQLGLLLVLLLSACLPVNGSASADEDATLEAARADYRRWARVNPEPLKIPDWLAAMCKLPPPDQQARLDSPHSDEYSNVYVNPVGTSAMSLASDRVFPAGTIIVKEKLLKVDDKVAEALGLMIKHEKGYNPAGDDWEYAYWQTGGTIQRDIEATQHCQACHIGTTISPKMEAAYRQSGEWVSRKARDSVFSGFVVSP